MHTGVKVIHISERDTQVTDRPKEVDEFVNTWSIEGFYEEGIAPSELGWGTHERRLPAAAHTYDYGPCSQICLSQMGMDTFVYSWVPLGGQIVGMVIRHGEACRSPSISPCPTATDRSIDRRFTTRICRPTRPWIRCTSCACVGSNCNRVCASCKTRSCMAATSSACC